MKQLNWYQIFGNTKKIPDGRTVEPTDDIQIWLHCADIWDKTYTTLAEVLADTDTLLALITSNNAVDYMVRSTTWASGVSADSSAMTYIGQNNYAANTLLADATWRNAICNSEYFESVLNVKVPTMTDNTHPSGEASASTVYQTNYAYKAFDGDDSTKWECGFVASDLYPYVQYDFGSNVKICCAKAFEKGSSGNAFIYGHKIEYSEDNVTFTEAASGESSSITASQSYNVLESFPLVTGRYFRFRSWRVNQEQFSGGDIYTLQFYGRKDV